jgi:alpha-beta hydrolase superfamily lysophospholipase
VSKREAGALSVPSTMSAQVIEDTFPAGDGLPLFERRWLPAGEPHGEVILVHGFIEHGGRYRPTAEALAARGFVVSVADLRGHGRSGGARCWVTSFDDYLDDLDRAFDRVRRRQDDKPLFLFGHSLGGLIAVLWCIRRQPALRGLILSGPAFELPDRLFPWLRHAAKIGSVLFPRLRLVRMGCRNISRDEAVVRQFREDPLVFHGRFPVRTGAEILRAGEVVRQRFQEVRVPLLILHGTADRVATVDASRALYEQAQTDNKRLCIYDGLYHEVLNEPEREQVRADLIEWIEEMA